MYLIKINLGMIDLSNENQLMLSQFEQDLLLIFFSNNKTVLL